MTKNSIKDTIEELHRVIKFLQDDCQHKNLNKEYKSNTGNYDPSCDSYWIEYECLDCGKRWDEITKTGGW